MLATKFNEFTNSEFLMLESLDENRFQGKISGKIQIISTIVLSITLTKVQISCGDFF
jgi:hypothetical protein